ncbi:hypothetical protein J1781_11535 [Rahnella sp. C60]|uniref:hypothetical protein n=1 Tax=Rahnella TaxID=34037 RepID=UPI0010203523|nr:MULTISPECIES: hypothetical protein [Rahnella]MBU9815483.1 hypothetical protein [Rahnella perminowiae]UJD88851.1 hypothetical protein FS594_08635 [Rahnella aquatilis]
MNSKAAVVGGLVITSVIAVLLALAFHFHANAVKSEGKADQLQSDNNLQALTISTQAFTFQRSNEIAGAAQKYAVKIIGDSQEKEIEYRTILKTEPSCTLPIPADVANGLYDYANRLRSSAMYADTSQPVKAAVSATTTKRITYCQAVLWIDPLLTLIEQANNQLAGIRQIDDERHENLLGAAK